MLVLCLLTVISLIGFFLISWVAGSVTLSRSGGISGLVRTSSNVTVTDVNGVTANPTVPVAQPGVLTVHTTGTTGTLTMTNAGHGIITGQRVDIYWATGSCYGAIVGTVSGTSVPIASVAGGDALPAAFTAVQVGIPVSSPFNVIGNNIQGLVLDSPSAKARFVLDNAGGDTFAALVNAANTFSWLVGDVATNPIANDTITSVFMSHDDVTSAHTDVQAATVTH